MLNASGRFDARRDAPRASRPKAASAGARGGALHAAAARPGTFHRSSSSC